jgi:NitT/TauT family transport system ATP-binding protein
LQGVGKRYETKDGPVEACAEIDLDIRRSEFVAIVGPSGCGKTTILKMVAGLVPHTAGSITVGGRTVDRPLTDVGIVFQEAILLDWRSVLSNVMLQIDIRGMDAAASNRWRALQATGCPASSTSPYELSAACASAISICRALITTRPCC